MSFVIIMRYTCAALVKCTYRHAHAVLAEINKSYKS